MTTTTAPTSAPAVTTLEEVRPLGSIPLWSATRPNAAYLLDISRATAYRLAPEPGRVPGAFRISDRWMVAVPALRRFLGDLPADPSS